MPIADSGGPGFLLSRGPGIILFDVAPNDPPVYMAGVGLPSVPGVQPTFFPARRASPVAPMLASRYE